MTHRTNGSDDAKVTEFDAANLADVNGGALSDQFSWAGAYNGATEWTYGMGDLGAYQVWNYASWFI